MGCMGLVCGWGLLTGRLWFLVEGLDQGANSRRRIQSLRFLQEAERPVGLVALDGVEGDEKELSTLREGQTGDWKGKGTGYLPSFLPNLSVSWISHQVQVL